VPVLDIYTRKTLVYEYEPIPPEVLERVKSAPLRFTWELSLPGYYSPKSGTKNKNIDALVIISDDLKRPQPQDIQNKASLYPLQKKFNQSSNIFQHQTFVTVYHK
jgi:hypothetical protein